MTEDKRDGVRTGGDGVTGGLEPSLSFVYKSLEGGSVTAAVAEPAAWHVPPPQAPATYKPRPKTSKESSSLPFPFLFFLP